MIKLPLLLSIFFLSNLGSIALSGETKRITIPNRQELNKILLKAYACSKENTLIACKDLKRLAEPLMDNPYLSTACKDLVWDLLNNSKIAPSNNLKRRDSIEIPARKITSSCRKKPKTSKKKNRNSIQT